MVDRLILGVEATLFLVAMLVLSLLPVIIACIDDKLFYTSGRRQLTIIAVGYLLLSVVFFAAIAKPAHAAVNAATIVRIKCKQTPPELRSPKCKRLVGTN